MIERHPVLKFKLLNESAKLPSYANPDDAGFDLYSPVDGVIPAGDREIIPLGIVSEIPEGWFVLIRGRSGLAVKFGIAILASVVDAGYRGEWKAILLNTGKEDFTYEKGERVAQGILLPAPQARIVQVDELSETQRGEGGFGSTGRK